MTRFRPIPVFLVAACAIVLAICASGCNANQTATAKRYHLQGEVLSLDVSGKTVYVKHGDIPGYMGAMSMGYSVRESNEISALGAGDKIQADVVMEKGQAHLEKIVITERAAALPSEPSSKK